MVGRRGTIGIGIVGVVAIAGILVVGDAVVGPDPERTAGGVEEPLPDLLPWGDVTWVRVDPPSMGGPLAQVPVSITRIPGGLVVLGHDAEGVEDAQRQVGSVWVSSDGRAWPVAGYLIALSVVTMLSVWLAAETHRAELEEC